MSGGNLFRKAAGDDTKLNSNAAAKPSPAEQDPYSFEKNISIRELVSAPTELASTNFVKGGRSPMSEHYFDKFLEEKFANIEDKFSAIKEENNRMREDIKADIKSYRDEIKTYADGIQRTVDLVQRSVEQTLAEMRERDKQRHAENLAINARIEENVKAIINMIDTTKKWMIGFIVATGLSVIGLAITAILSVASLIK